MFDPVAYVTERHNYWWNHLLQNTPGANTIADKTPPTIRWAFHKSRTHACANHLYCKYNLNYVILRKDDYDSTIAHELCHSLARRMRLNDGPQGHGTFWQYLHKHICGFSGERFYKGEVRCTEVLPSVKAIKTLIATLEKRSEAAQR
jgi:predicted SprT family Zn-dependent metalloprotease